MLKVRALCSQFLLMFICHKVKLQIQSSVGENSGTIISYLIIFWGKTTMINNECNIHLDIYLQYYHNSYSCGFYVLKSIKMLHYCG